MNTASSKRHLTAADLPAAAVTALQHSLQAAASAGITRSSAAKLPKREIQEEMRASGHDLEEVEERGVASSQRVVRSMMVRMCVWP
jgi:hypothetical protein